MRSLPSLVAQHLRRAILAGLLALLALLTLPATAQPADPGMLTSNMSVLLNQQGLTGAVWALVDPVHGLRTGAAGLKDAATGEPMRAEHRVHVGSITKTVLALGVLRLASQRRLALDQPLASVLPTVAIDNPWAATDPVRLRHLLDHSAGLDDARLSQVLSLRATPDAPLSQAFERDGALLRLRFRPGSRSSYSNMGYALLGCVIEAVTAERYENWLDRELLRPLSLHDSTFAFTTQSPGPHADPRLAMGHGERGQPMPAPPTWLRPASQFTTTAADMGRLAQFLMGDGRVEGRPFIDPALLQAMGRPTHTEAARAGLAVGYAAGLATRDRHGVLGRCHGGNIVGYRAMFCLFDNTRRAFFVSINTDSDSADHNAIDRMLIAALDSTAPPAAAAAATATTTTARAPATDPTPWLGWYVPAPSRFESLALIDRLGAVQRLVRDPAGTGLRLRPAFGAAGVSLAPAPGGGPLLQAEGRVAASHALVLDAEGRRIISTGLGHLGQVSAAAVAGPWASFAAGVLGLALLLARGLALAVRALASGLALAARMRRAKQLQQSNALRPSPPAPRPLWIALGGLLAGLVLPACGLLLQPFLALGDLTPATAALAAGTALLPAALLAALAVHWRTDRRGGWAAVDAAAMLALLQAGVLLAAWGWWPVRLWH
jgi:CubicO group peptidase (beta-lactamase class C family)